MAAVMRAGAGPFQQLNAEAIEQELGEMSRALYKLSKVFSDQPAPRNVADRVRRQIEKFKSYQALLNVICNPGIRDRHWKKVTSLNVLECGGTHHLGLEMSSQSKMS